MIRFAWISKEKQVSVGKHKMIGFTLSLNLSLYGYTCENDGGAQPLTRREFVVINDDRKQHGEQFARESDGDES